MLSQASEGNATGETRYTVAPGFRSADCREPDTRHVRPTRHQSSVPGLVASLAERCVSLEAGAIDNAIGVGLRHIAEALGLDHVFLWRTESDVVSVAASHFAPNTRPLPEAALLASIPVIASKLRDGEAAWCTRLDEVPDPVSRAAFVRHAIRSAAIVPVEAVAGTSEERGVLVYLSTTTEYEWTPAIMELLRLTAAVLRQALARKASQHALQRALDELDQLRERPSGKGELTRRDVISPRASQIVPSSASASVRFALAQAELVARTPSTVLLLGETGSGKEVFAQAIHALSPRYARPMIRVNCAAIPTTLIESELFGRERGAYTGALTRQMGRFEAAHLSTIFLDEIGELPLDVQSKLLRVLQDRVIERLGSTQSTKVDVRIIVATNRNLEDAVANKTFREDLFYRLNVFPITVPPLRERVEDIRSLVWEFIDEFSKAMGKPIESITEDSMRQLEQYSWPGNVRELRNVIERAVILANGPRLGIAMPQLSTRRQAPSATALADVQFEHIRATLESTRWRVRGSGGAAERLGIKPTTLESRMAKMGIVRPGTASNAPPSVGL